MGCGEGAASEPGSVRDGHGRQEEAPGNRGQENRRQAGTVRGRERTCFPQRRRSRDDFGAGRAHAIELGGVYDGHEAPEDVHKLTKASLAALAGQGLVEL